MVNVHPSWMKNYVHFNDPRTENSANAKKRKIEFEKVLKNWC